MQGMSRLECVHRFCKTTIFMPRYHAKIVAHTRVIRNTPTHKSPACWVRVLDNAL